MTIAINRAEFEAYEEVRLGGEYNMFDPRARDLAQEFCEEEISRGDWVHMIKNYSELKEQHNS